MIRVKSSVQRCVLPKSVFRIEFAEIRNSSRTTLNYAAVYFVTLTLDIPKRGCQP